MEEFTQSPAATAEDKYFGDVRTANVYASKQDGSLHMNFGIREYFDKTFISIENFTRGKGLTKSGNSKKFAKKKPGPAEASGILKEGDVILEVVSTILSIFFFS